MAATARNKQGLRRQSRNLSNFSKTREYGEMLYGHKRKASYSPSNGDASIKRVTRSSGSKPGNKLTDGASRNSPETLASKIPRLNKNAQRTNSLAHQTGTIHCFTENVLSAHEPELVILEMQKSKKDQNEHSQSDLNTIDVACLNRKVTDPGRPGGEQQIKESPPDQSNILSTLANIDQRLKKLDKLDEISSSLTGEFNTVQSQVGEVANQVNSVKSDLNRCEEKLGGKHLSHDGQN